MSRTPAGYGGTDGGREEGTDGGGTRAEEARLAADATRAANWKRWGPYLAARQWGTVREDYSEAGEPWGYFPHDHARSRAYRWGEDGLLGLTDRQGRLCLALSLWNGRDPYLKERLFGLSNEEGNHGEDVKEVYHYLDATPTHSYLKALYRYPLDAFPYDLLRAENRRRGLTDPEFEIEDTGIFDHGRYVDVEVEYAKASPEDVLVRVTLANRSAEEATLHVLPTLWFRNTWTWGGEGEDHAARPTIVLDAPSILQADHPSLGSYRLDLAPGPDGRLPAVLFTENETNAERLFGARNASPYVKDAFHERVVGGRLEAVNPAHRGTKAAAWYVVRLPARGEVCLRLRLSAEGAGPPTPFGEAFEDVFAARIREAEAFYASRAPPGSTEEERRVQRQAYAGLLWSKQFYHYVVREWLAGDATQPSPPASRRQGRNREWRHLYNRDVISMPDTWEYPWYAAWDLAFHALPLAKVDPELAKEQLLLFLREWYMHPNGQIPAYEWNLSDVNPPVHAWACWRVYKMTARPGHRDRTFLRRAFQKLLLNFTWWVNRKDADGENVFSGGFLGLDNIGVLDRSKPLPRGGRLEQADGTAWMAFYASTMLSMALELAGEDAAYEDMASKFFEHFVAIVDAMNSLGGTGLWDEEDGFYYDQLRLDGRRLPLRVRSVVGLVPLFAVEVLDDAVLHRLPAFQRRLRWFLRHRRDLAARITYMEKGRDRAQGEHLLAVPSKERLLRVLRVLLDEREFLAPHGIRSLSRAHADDPYVLVMDGVEHRVAYAPADSDSRIFGGNSNWRGPIWFPVNFLLVEALERYHHFYGDTVKVECPTGSGRLMNLEQVAREISRRLTSLFLPDANGRRPCFGDDPRRAADPRWRDLLLFHECFDGDTGRGLGASHQTGWTALVTRLLEGCRSAPKA